MELKTDDLKSLRKEHVSRNFLKKEHQDDIKFIDEWKAIKPSDRHILVIDEFGDTSLSGKSTDSKFGLGISDVNHPAMYAGLSRFNRILNFGKEKKANKSSIPGRTVMSAAIRATGSETSCVYVDKKGKMPIYMHKDQRERILGVLDDTLKESLPKEGVVWVVVDSNTQYSEPKYIQSVCSKYNNSKRTVLCKQYDSSNNGLSSDLIQTNDYVTNAARSDLRMGKKLRSRILKMKFIKIEK